MSDYAPAPGTPFAAVVEKIEQEKATLQAMLREKDRQIAEKDDRLVRQVNQINAETQRTERAFRLAHDLIQRVVENFSEEVYDWNEVSDLVELGMESFAQTMTFRVTTDAIVTVKAHVTQPNKDVVVDVQSTVRNALSDIDLEEYEEASIKVNYVEVRSEL